MPSEIQRVATEIAQLLGRNRTSLPTLLAEVEQALLAAITEATTEEEGRDLCAFFAQAGRSVTAVGVRGAGRLLGLHPLARAKGRSRFELEEMLDREARGLDTRLVVTVRANDPKFPVEVQGLGSYGVSPGGGGRAYATA